MIIRRTSTKPGIDTLPKVGKASDFSRPLAEQGSFFNTIS